MAKIANAYGKISVIVPVFNAGIYLEECLNSILDQTYEHIEVIMIDDGSTDQSAQICKKFEARDVRFKLINTSNNGVSSARNIGITHATGEYITFIDSDDFIALDMLEYLYRLIMDGDGDISTCMLEQVDHTSMRTDSYRNSYGAKYKSLNREDAIAEMLYSKNLIINGSFCKLFKATLLDEVKFNTDIYYAEDLLMNYFIFKKAKMVCVGEEIKYYYRIHMNSAMRKVFSIKRMSGINACNIILDDARAEADTSIINAALNRHFMEAIAIILQIPRDSSYSKQMRECALIIRQSKWAVLMDVESKLAYRLYALFYFFGIHIGTKVVRIVRECKGEI